MSSVALNGLLQSLKNRPDQDRLGLGLRLGAQTWSAQVHERRRSDLCKTDFMGFGRGDVNAKK